MTSLKIGDDVRAGRIFLAGSPGDIHSDVLKYFKNIHELANTAVSFHIQNVSEFVAAKKVFTLAEDLPTMAPQFDVMWLECLAPHDPLVEVGVLIWSRRIADDEQEFAGAWINQSIEDGMTRVIVNEARWIMRMYLFAKVEYEGTFHPYVFDGVLNGTGMPCEIHGLGRGLATTKIARCPVEVDLEDALVVSTPALMAIAFMHCKNVSQSEVMPSRQERRELARRQKPLVIYRTLQIEPMKRVLESEGGMSHNGLKKALHICRGHFSEYTDEKPLFGKYAGRFWIPAHVRGTAEAGKIIKDYRVMAPSAVAEKAAS